MRAHLIENGVVSNTLEVESLDFMPNLIEAIEGSIGWVYADGVFSPPVVDAETLAKQIALEASEAKQKAKMTGVSILGVMCSATKTDQSGLSAVALGVTLARMAGATFPDTKFEFENGSSLVVTDENFDTIYAAWAPFRQSFFRP
jgi:hypothetical protein